MFLLTASSLLGSAVRTDAFSKQTLLPAAQSILVSSQYFIPLEIQTFSNSSLIDYYVSSNVSISTALMNSQQFNLFNNTNTDDISNALSDRNGTIVNQQVSVSSGTYYLVFFDYSQSDANVTFSYQAYPVTPFVIGPLYPPEPTGLASFGISNESGNAIPYDIKTSSVIGVANITSIQAYNSSAPILNDTVSGATLQLNAVIVVDENGSQYVYWCQDTPDFVTNVSQVSFGDNLWNNSDLAGFLSNQTVTSPNGNSVYATNDNGTSQYYYGFGTNNYTYVEPFDIRLLMNESIVSAGVLLQMGSQVLRNGSQTNAQPIFWFDNITINDPGVQSAYFYVSGNDSTPVGSFYDAELVFAGEGNLEATNFTQMDSTLGLFYLNSSNELSAFPTYYSFGGDTGEATYNLHVQYSGNGVAQVTVGTPNYVYLNAVSNSTTASTSGITTAQISGTTSTQSQVLSSVTTATPGASSISSSYLLVVIPVFTIMIVLGVFASRRRRTVFVRSSVKERFYFLRCELPRATKLAR
jgi:thermopsin